jgi:putative ABC transport system permease protein
MGAERAPGRAARRAVRHWTWRMFRREWRQQIMIIGLLTLAVGTSFVGAAAATNIPPPANAGFGTAHYMLTLPTTKNLASTLARVSRAVGSDQVIENQALSFPGSVTTYDLRATDPHGPFGGPLLSLVLGRYPVGAGQVAVTSTVASALDLHVGSTWRLGATTREVVGIVQNPQSLLDAFALVAPGQVTAPTQVTILFDQAPKGLGPLGHFVAQPPPAQTGISSPATLVVLADALGLILIGLVSIAGFTVIAQRRLRSLGMIRALGASDRNVRSVVRTNGLMVGVTSVVAGTVLGLVVWLVYRPDLESTQHHVIGLWHLPWLSIVAALALGLLTPVLASGRPGRLVARVPVVAALAGRPAPPKSVTRTALPGIVVLIVSFLLLGDAARSNGSSALPLLLGFVALAVGVVLLAPTFVASLAGIRRAPLAVRLATRDLVRYRARSASTLAAISIGVLTAMVVMIATTARYANVLDFVGPNMTSNQLVVYYAGGFGPGSGPPPPIATATAVDHGIAKSLLATSDVALYSTSATLDHNGPGRQFTGNLYVATPTLLRAFHISARQIDPKADILTMRPGFAGMSHMQLTWNGPSGGKGGPGSPGSTSGCPRSGCAAIPVMQTISALPAGTSAPNTVITEHAISTFHLATSESLNAWLIITPQPLTTAQIAAARQTAGAAGLSVESKNSAPTSAEVVNYATGAALLIALFVLAMSIGLIRAETAGDRRTLAAAGASARTRRSITAATGGALALLGAVLGSAGAYVATAAFFSNSKQNEAGSLLSSLTQVPAMNLLAIFVGLPLLAVVGGWLLAGREPRDVARAPE